MKYFIPVIVVGFFIAYLSLTPKLSLPKEGVLGQSDKVAHFLVYFLLSFSASWGFLRKNKKISKSLWLYIILVCIVYGILLEILQELIPDTRQFDFLDILANVLGVLANKVVFKRFFIA